MTDQVPPEALQLHLVDAEAPLGPDPAALTPRRVLPSCTNGAGLAESAEPERLEPGT